MNKLFGLSTWLFFALSIIIVFVFLLANVNKCEATEFCATEIFFTIFTGSLIMMILLAMIDDTSAKSMAKQNVRFFYMRDFY